MVVSGHGYRGLDVFVRNVAGGTVYLGDETVTPDTGFALEGQATLGPLHVYRGQELWAVRGAGTSSLHVLIHGQLTDVA